MTPFRICAAAIGWSAILLQYALVMNGAMPWLGAGAAVRTVNFFSYFTMLANALAATALTLPWLAPRSRLAAFFAAHGVRTAIAVYLAMVCIVYAVMLRHLWAPHGALWIADTTLHYVMPALFVADWLVAPHSGTLRPAQTITWLAFPTAYSIWLQILGAVTGFYPYPFVDSAAFGFVVTMTNAIGLGLVIVAFGLGFVGLDRLLARRTRP